MNVQEMIIYNPDTLERHYLPNFDTVYFDDMAPNNVLKETSAYITVETLLPMNVNDITHIIGITG